MSEHPAYGLPHGAQGMYYDAPLAPSQYMHATPLAAPFESRVEGGWVDASAYGRGERDDPGDGTPTSLYLHVSSFRQSAARTGTTGQGGLVPQSRELKTRAVDASAQGVYLGATVRSARAGAVSSDANAHAQELNTQRHRRSTSADSSASATWAQATLFPPSSPALPPYKARLHEPRLLLPDEWHGESGLGASVSPTESTYATTLPSSMSGMTPESLSAPRTTAPTEDHATEAPTQTKRKRIRASLAAKAEAIRSPTIQRARKKTNRALAGKERMPAPAHHAIPEPEPSSAPVALTSQSVGAYTAGTSIDRLQEGVPPLDCLPTANAFAAVNASLTGNNFVPFDNSAGLSTSFQHIPGIPHLGFLGMMDYAPDYSQVMSPTALHPPLGDSSASVGYLQMPGAVRCTYLYFRSCFAATDADESRVDDTDVLQQALLTNQHENILHPGAFSGYGGPSQGTSSAQDVGLGMFSMELSLAIADANRS